LNILDKVLGLSSPLLSGKKKEGKAGNLSFVDRRIVRALTKTKKPEREYNFRLTEE
jgi:hypothetical protein